MSEDDNLVRVREGFDAFRRGDLETIAGFLDPEVKWHGGNPADAGACVNRDQALRYMRSRRRPADQLPEIDELVAAGDQVVVILRTPAREDAPPRVHANLTTLRNGRAIEMVHFDDPADALREVGVERPRRFDA